MGGAHGVRLTGPGHSLAGAGQLEGNYPPAHSPGPADGAAGWRDSRPDFSAKPITFSSEVQMKRIIYAWNRDSKGYNPSSLS